MNSLKNNIRRRNQSMGFGFFDNNTIDIDAIVYDQDGQIAGGVYAWPEGRPQDQTYILSNGELMMSNINKSTNIVFSFQGKRITIPANEIGGSVTLDLVTSLDVAADLGVITNKKDNTLLYFGLGTLLLVLIVKMSEKSEIKKSNKL